MKWFWIVWGIFWVTMLVGWVVFAVVNEIAEHIKERRDWKERKKDCQKAWVWCEKEQRDIEYYERKKKSERTKGSPPSGCFSFTAWD